MFYLGTLLTAYLATTKSPRRKATTALLMLGAAPLPLFLRW